MALLPIIEAPDPRLRTISTPVESIDDALQTLIDDMLETMYDAPGIGLAAIQVGVPKRLLVIDLQEPESDEEDAKPVRNPMVFTDRWTLLMVIIALVQLVLVLFGAKKEKEPAAEQAVETPKPE